MGEGGDFYLLRPLKRPVTLMVGRELENSGERGSPLPASAPEAASHAYGGEGAREQGERENVQTKVGGGVGIIL